MAFLSFRTPALKALAVPTVCLLICFLAYSPQYLFYYLDPGPLTTNETVWFNLLVAGTWWSYERTCRVNPGRLPKNIAHKGLEDHQNNNDMAREKNDERFGLVNAGGRRWCKKCEAVKPPRTHHCKQCGRCIPKMDHHCPWTSNCISHTTFPHFLRFVYYTCASLVFLGYHLYIRLYHVYLARNLPSYLGPSMGALVHLFIMTFITALLLFALTILLVTATWSLLTNTTMIESWEIERHDALVEKSKYHGGFVHGPGGRRVKIRKQEFPYDIGIWKNIVQGMGGSNILTWALPFGGGPSNESGWGPWEENGFEDEGMEWPPVDPDKLPRFPRSHIEEERSAFIHGDDDEVQAFKRRQEEDYKRWETIRQKNVKGGSRLRSSADVTSRHGESTDEDGENGYEHDEGMDGEPGWTNSDGDRLRDYGVDEEAEMIFEDDIPLGELLRRRRATAMEQD